MAFLSAACGPPLIKLPSGPGAPAPDAAAVVAEAMAICSNVFTFTAEIAASGSVGGQRIRGHLLAGLARPASARLEALAPVGQPMFIFVASGDDATLLLPRDDRVLEHGRPADVLEAVAGVPLNAVGLRAALTGCALAPDVAGTRRLGDDWRMVPDGSSALYLHHDHRLRHWQLVAAIHHSNQARGGRDDWRVDYGDFEVASPRTVRLRSLDGRRFDLTLKLSQVAVNERLGPDVFRVYVPASAARITIDDLRHARPGLRED